MYIKSYRICKHCNREIVSSRHNDHESKCLRMQAEKLSKNKKIGHPVGMPAWNKGLTKSDPRVKKNAESASNTFQKQIKDGTYVPRKMGAEASRRLSEEQALHNRGGKSTWFEVSGIKVQGTWERDIALKLNEFGIKWSKPKTNNDLFKYVMNGKQRSYAPDFYLVDLDIYLEVKGYWWGNDKEKMKLVMEQNPDKKIFLIEKEQYKKIMGGELVW